MHNLFKRGISLVASICMMFLCCSFALAECENEFANGGDAAMVCGIEYYINSEDSDFLYAGDTLMLDKHIITLIASDNDLYLVSYENGSSKLLKYDTEAFICEELLSFESIVTSIAFANGKLFFTDNGAIKVYDVLFNTTTALITDDVSFLYLKDANTLKYYNESGLNVLYLDGRNVSAFSSNDKNSTSFYTPRLTAPDTDDPYYTDLNPLHRGGYGMVDNGGNCTCYAYGRSYENLGKDPKLCTRSAGKWYDYNKDEGRYEYGQAPALGAVAVWTKPGADGHVAVVEVIDGDTVITSESGWKTYYFRTKARSMESSNFSASSAYCFEGFIYVLGHIFSSETAIKYASISLPSVIKQGSAFPLKGTISSSGSPLTKISVIIRDLDGNVALSASVNPASYSYNIKNSELDNAVAFGTLDVGTYNFIYSASTESGKVESRIHTFTVEPVKIAGDVNCDSKLNSKDISELQRALAANSVEDITPFDIDENDKLDSRDLSKLQRLING